MIKINVVAVGKVKEKYFAEGINEYKKRISKYADFTITELPEENFSKITDGGKTIIERETSHILPHLKGYVIANCIEGEKFSSESFSRTLKGLFDRGEGVITFVIGGSYGLSNEVKKRANKLVSFSDMTFPHTLFRLMLTEQIYRAFNIINNTPYHK